MADRSEGGSSYAIQGTRPFLVRAAGLWMPGMPCDAQCIAFCQPEKPIQRPLAATVNHSITDTSATSVRVLSLKRPSSANATRLRTVNAKIVANSSADHLHRERRTVVALDGFGREERPSRDDEHDQAGAQKALRLARELGNRSSPQADLEHAHVHQKHGAAHRRQRQQVHRLDDCKRPHRLAHHPAEPGFL